MRRKGAPPVSAAPRSGLDRQIWHHVRHLAVPFFMDLHPQLGKRSHQNALPADAFGCPLPTLYSGTAGVSPAPCTKNGRDARGPRAGREPLMTMLARAAAQPLRVCAHRSTRMRPIAEFL